MSRNFPAANVHQTLLCNDGHIQRNTKQGGHVRLVQQILRAHYTTSRLFLGHNFNTLTLYKTNLGEYKILPVKLKLKIFHAGFPAT
jgi:hypothetical protein